MEHPRITVAKPVLDPAKRRAWAEAFAMTLSPNPDVVAEGKRRLAELRPDRPRGKGSI